MKYSALPRSCLSLGERGARAVLGFLQGVEFAEIRIDLCQLSLAEVKRVFTRKKGRRLIATCRPGRHSDQERIKLLQTAISTGADLLDLELRASKRTQQALISFAREHNCRVIISQHYKDRTPRLRSLHGCLNECFERGADIAKIACYVPGKLEAMRLLSLLEDRREVVVVGMGPFGARTRVAALMLDCPFTYVSLNRRKSTASGQISRSELEAALKLLDGSQV